MAEEPRITQAQYEIWLSDQTTKTFLKALEWKRLDTRDGAGDGTLVDSSNSDLTSNLMHRALGQQDVYAELQDPLSLFTHYAVIEEPNDE